MTLCEKEEYRGCTINVYYDPDADDPRSWGNVATFVCEHRRYDLGDEHDIEKAINHLFYDHVSDKAIIEYFIKNREETYKDYIDGDTDLSDDEIAYQLEIELDLGEKLQLIEESGEVVTLPISMYDHSGITLWLGSKWSHYDAQWDCSSIGFAYIEKSTAEKEGMLDPGEKYNHDWKEWAYAMMEAEMKTYDQFIRGEVYGYMIEDEEGEEASDNLLCGCWSFYDKNELITEAKTNIDAYLKEKAETRKNNLDILMKSVALIFNEVFADDDYSYRVSKDMFGFDFIERAKFNRSHLGCYAEIGFSALPDEILEDMVYEIKKRMV